MGIRQHVVHLRFQIDPYEVEVGPLDMGGPRTVVGGLTAHLNDAIIEKTTTVRIIIETSYNMSLSKKQHFSWAIAPDLYKAVFPTFRVMKEVSDG